MEGRVKVVRERPHREALRSFIQTYESLPELWNTSHASYSDKTRRSLALDKLRGVYCRMKPDASRADVRRKINTLRSNYRKELKKMVTSRRSSGRDPSDLYRPTSWVFHALRFLQNCEHSVHVDLQAQQIPEGDTLVRGQKEKNSFERVEANGEPSPLSSSRSAILSTTHPTKFSACAYRGNSRELDDCESTIAKVWAEKLLTLDQQQRLFAEKAINDVLFEAGMGNLHRHSVKINEESSRAANRAVPTFSLNSESTVIKYPLKAVQVQGYLSDDGNRLITVIANFKDL